MPPPRKRRSRKGSGDGPADPLFGALRETRRAIAAQAGVPAYVVFHDSTLREIAAARPGSLAELSAISGVGEAKLRSYGQAMIETVRAFEAEGAPGPR